MPDGTRLRVTPPPAGLTDSDRTALRQHKAALLDLLAAPPEPSGPVEDLAPTPAPLPRHPPPRYPAPGVAPSNELAALPACVRDPLASRYVLLLAWREASAEAAARCTGEARRAALARVARYDREIADVVKDAGAHRDGEWMVFPNAGEAPRRRFAVGDVVTVLDATGEDLYAGTVTSDAGGAAPVAVQLWDGREDGIPFEGLRRVGGWPKKQ